MVDKISQQGYLVVTWANWHYWDFVRTWVMHVKQVGGKATAVTWRRVGRA